MHGLIFETSVWLLAGSTRLLKISIITYFLEHVPGGSQSKQKDIRILNSSDTSSRNSNLKDSFISEIWCDLSITRCLALEFFLVENEFKIIFSCGPLDCCLSRHRRPQPQMRREWKYHGVSKSNTNECYEEQSRFEAKTFKFVDSVVEEMPAARGSMHLIYSKGISTLRSVAVQVYSYYFAVRKSTNSPSVLRRSTCTYNK